MTLTQFLPIASYYHGIMAATELKMVGQIYLCTVQWLALHALDGSWYHGRCQAKCMGVSHGGLIEAHKNNSW